MDDTNNEIIKGNEENLHTSVNESTERTQPEGKVELEKELAEKQKMINSIIESNSDDIKYKILATILTEKGIAYDSNITSYNALKKYAKENLSKEDYKNVISEEEESRKEVADFAKELEAGGPYSVDRFVRGLKTNFLRPAAQNALMLIISRALFDAALFLPTPVNAILGVASLGTTILRGPAKLLAEKKKKQAEMYDAILEDIETKRDEDGLTTEKRFSQHEIDTINEFFRKKEMKKDIFHLNKIDEYKDIEFESYREMKAKIALLKNKDKYELIKELNKLSETEDRIAKQISKQDKLRKVKTAGKVVGNIGLGLGVGVLMSNIDKEIQPLIKLPIPKRIVRKIFQNRTYYESNEFIKSFADAIGFKSAIGFSVVKNAILGSIKAFSQSRESKKRAEQDANAELTINQKLVFEIVKHDALHKHPESVDEINELATLGELKNYLNNLPTNEKKDSVKLLDNLIGEIEKRDAKDVIKDLGNTLGNSVLLAGNSILLYEIILALHHGLHLTPIAKPKPEQDPEPEPEPVPVTAKEREPNSVPAPESDPVTVHVPEHEQNPSMVPENIPEPVTSPALDSIPAHSHARAANSHVGDGATNGRMGLVDMPYKAVGEGAEKVYVEADLAGAQSKLEAYARTQNGKQVIDTGEVMKKVEEVKKEVSEQVGQKVEIKDVQVVEKGVDTEDLKDAALVTGATVGGAIVASLVVKGILVAVTIAAPEAAPITGPMIVAPI
ncbi:MAG: hypothetical protein IJH12_08495 [Clostridia bacterium]|nr:hypothetical protein [Clostridia bacterium]